MNPILRYSLLIRLLLSPTLYFTRKNVLYTILLLLFLDVIDCNFILIKTFPKKFKNKYCSLDKDYEFFDKCVDLFQYMVAINTLKPILPVEIYHNIVYFIVYRLVGIVMFYKTKIDQSYIVFFDFIKEYLLLYVIYGVNIPKRILYLTIILKIIYEYTMHQRHIMLDTYKYLFE